MLVAHDVVFEYPGKRALDHVAFSLPAGSVTALVGPNGAGKTTLLRCLAGLDTPLAGRLQVDGVDVEQNPRECHRRLGYLPDHFGVWPALSVARSLEFVARANGMAGTAMQEAVRATATRLGLADRLGEAAGSLSRGLRQRLAIGQAIIHAPRVLLLDEPASGLDPEARHDLATVFRQLQAGGMTLLVSSHILAELAEYCSHMLVMREGRIVEHRALATHTAGAGERVRVQFAAPVDSGALAFLSREPGLAALSTDADGRGLALLLEGGAQGRARLLARLVHAGLPVEHFGPETESLQQSYLAAVRTGRPA